MKILYFKFIPVVVSALIFTSCDNASQIREYEEITVPSELTTLESRRLSPTMQELNQEIANSASVSQINLRWAVPQGWQEMDGQGMRLISFRNERFPEAIDCSIVILAGAAGGLEANVVRWIRQIKLPVPEAGTLKTFIEAQPQIKTVGNLSGQYIDLTLLHDNAEDDVSSTLAAILQTRTSQIFIKMTGTLKAIDSNRSQFQALVESISENQI